MEQRTVAKTVVSNLVLCIVLVFALRGNANAFPWPFHHRSPAPRVFAASAYDAKCDGVTDDTAAINSAVRAAHDAGRSIVALPSGTCRNLSGSIVLYSDVFLTGKGRGQTTLEPVREPKYPVVTFAAGTHSSGVSNLAINGNAASAGTRTADGIYAPNGTSGIDVQDVEVYATADNCIEVDGTDSEVHANYVHGCYTNGLYAIGASDAHRARNIRFHDDLVVNTSVGNVKWDGIDVDPCTENIRVYNETVVGNDIIDYESGKTCSSSFRNSFTNDTVIGSTENGLDLTGALHDITSSGNRFYTPTGYCIMVNTLGLPSYGLTFSHDYCTSPSKDGVYMANFKNPASGGPNDVAIVGERIDNIRAAYSGIDIQSGARRVRIRNDRITHAAKPILLDTIL
jgi:hypothetical protein